MKTDESIEIVDETDVISNKEDDLDVSAGPSILESELTAGIQEGASNDSGSEDEMNDKEEEFGRPPRAEEMETWAEELDEDVSQKPIEIKDWRTFRHKSRRISKRRRSPFHFLKSTN